MRIIPAIDVLGGKCVRLAQGDYTRKQIYNHDPLEVAKIYEAAGLKYLHLVDLDGAKAGKVVNWKTIEGITNKTNLKIDFGGGIKNDEDLKKVFDCGARQVTCGSIAVKNPPKVVEWASVYGRDKIIIGADVKGKKIAIHGWMEPTSLDIEDLLHKYLGEGLEYAICTDIATDGMLQGPNLSLYKDLLNTFPNIKLIASGGVSSIADIKALANLNLDGAIIGKALYENKISLTELSNFINA